MQEVTVKLYKFSELSEDAQNKLIAKRQQQNSEWLDTSELEEWLKNNLSDPDYAKQGEATRLPKDLFEIDRIYFSLGYSQGDGVAITGSFDTNALIERFKADNTLTDEETAIVDVLKEHISVSIGHSGRYSHANSISVNDCYFNTNHVVAQYFENKGISYEDADNAEFNTLESLADILYDRIADYGLEIVKDACHYAEREGYDYIEHETSEEVAREQLEQADQDEGERYMESGREL